MEPKVSRDALDREVSRAHVGTQEKRVNLVKLALTASMEKKAKVELLDPQEAEDTLAEEGPKVPKDKQEMEEKWESEETLVKVDGITTVQDPKETLVMPDHLESLVMMEPKAAQENLEEGELMAEEDHLDRLELLESQEVTVCRESLVLEDLEVHLDQMVPRDPEERMGILDPEVPEGVQVLLERRVEEELLVVRESQESQDRRVSLDLLVLVESLVRMEEMDLALQDPKEEREMKASQDSLDQREQLVILALKVDLDPEEIVDRGVSLGILVHLGRKERLDIQDLMVRKDQEDPVLCNVTWLRKSEITVLAVMVSMSVRSTPPSWRLPWTSLATPAQPSTTCVRRS